jgi:short-subunit dehydrogenase
VPHALVTGASSGIGLALAHQLERQGYSLVLASREPKPLNDALLIPIDLGQPGSAAQLFEATRHLALDVVICNAGFGRIGEHLELPLDEVTRMAHLNMTSLVEMCTLFGAPMKERRHGFLMNVASIAGFFPIPYFAQYAATKAFVVNFSRALTEELKPHGVKVSCLCPGPTATNFRTRADREPDYRRATSAEEVAERGLAGLWQGRPIVVTGGGRNRLITALARLIPPQIVAAWFRRRI